MSILQLVDTGSTCMSVQGDQLMVELASISAGLTKAISQAASAGLRPTPF